ncbi:MAG: cold shock domain-containing protein [Caldilineaceae bacterium]
MADRVRQPQDETLYCENCGISFIWTVEEQRPSFIPIPSQADVVEIEGTREGDGIGADSQDVHDVTTAALGTSEPLKVAGGLPSSSADFVPSIPPIYCPGCRYLLPADGRQRGIVKWYHRRKGYGFITRRNEPDLYVNRTALRHGHLQPGEFVEFSVGENQQGSVAKHVVAIEPM